MTAINPDAARSAGRTSTDDFGRCARCSMKVRRTEMEIHLAHAHNMGPGGAKKDKKDERRGGRGRSTSS